MFTQLLKAQVPYQHYFVCHKDSVSVQVKEKAGICWLKTGTSPWLKMKTAPAAETGNQLAQELRKRLLEACPDVSPVYIAVQSERISTEALAFFRDKNIINIKTVRISGTDELRLVRLKGVYTLSVVNLHTGEVADLMTRGDQGYAFQPEQLQRVIQSWKQINSMLDSCQNRPLIPVIEQHTGGFTVKNPGRKISYTPDGKLIIPQKESTLPTPAPGTTAGGKTAQPPATGSGSPSPATGVTNNSKGTDSTGNNGKEQTPAPKDTTKAAGEKPFTPQPLLPEQKISCSGDSAFTLHALSYAKPDSFTLELITPHVDKKTQVFSHQITEAEFVYAVKKMLEEYCKTTNASPEIGLFRRNLQAAMARQEKSKAEADLLTKQNDEIKKHLAAIGERIDALAQERENAALLEVRKQLPYYDEGEAICGQQQKMGQDKTWSAKKQLIKIDSVVMRVFNNNVYQLDVVGRVDGNPIPTLSNNNYGLSLRSLLDGGQTLKFYLAGKAYVICYNDLFFLRPSNDNVITYEIRDGVYRFFPDSSNRNKQQLEQKRLLDYISASAFIDLQAFGAENPNKNLLTELYFNYNINPYDIGKGVGLFKHVYLPITFGFNLFKQGETMPTFRKDTLLGTAVTGDSIYAKQYYYKNLDLLKHAFLQVRPMVNLITKDYKKMRSILELNGGFLLTGSNVRFTDPAKGTDSVFVKPIYSYSFLLEGRWRVNPRPKYGFDLHVMYSFGLRSFNPDMQSVTGRYSVEQLVRANIARENKDDYILGELNFFFNPRNDKSDTDRGGLYFKLNWYKAVSYPDGHFMFLVGYSSDIKNFFR